MPDWKKVSFSFFRRALSAQEYGYQSLLNKHVLPALGDKKLGEITSSGVTEFLHGIALARDKNRGPKLLNVYLLLRHKFEVATEYDLIPSNPVRKSFIAKGTSRRKNRR